MLIPAGFILTDERGLKCYLSPLSDEMGDLNNIFLHYKGGIQMAQSNHLAVAAVEDRKEIVIPPSRKIKVVPQGNEEIIITIRNGVVVKFVQNIYYPSLEGVDGDGI
ncbi:MULTISPECIES: hypothetical protein [Pelosinus]|nr:MULTISPECIES: hypothetical protein [Pelosinus]